MAITVAFRASVDGVVACTPLVGATANGAKASLGRVQR